MRILGIDPGTTESGWALYDSDSRAVIDSGTVNNDQVMVMLSPSSTLDFNKLAIEQIKGMGMLVGQEVFETTWWTGRFYQAAYEHVPVRRVPRHAEKMHLCGSMQAKDKNIRQALIDKLGPPGKMKDPGPTYGVSGDAWAALAVAVTAAETPETV
jgi:hypothetical protein